LGKDYGTRSRDILFNDIPVNATTDEVYELLNRIGRIEAMTIKTQFKYMSVKVKVKLTNYYER